MNFVYILLGIISILLITSSVYNELLKLYIWYKEDSHKAPQTFELPLVSFTIIIPARHEEEVIQDTIQSVVDLRYPKELVQILVIVEDDDIGTVYNVNKKLSTLSTQSIDNVRLVCFSGHPMNKPYSLNIGLLESTNDIIAVFDAEDDPHPDILQIVNTIIKRESVQVVQGGVQLMNYTDQWFCTLNALEYFFWFRGRMRYHASKGIVLLGGNTVFIRRTLLEQVNGWDQNCLTEDADLGVRLSVSVPIRVMYDDNYLTKEESPPTTTQFIRQRTRWNQGFFQVLTKQDWLHLPTWSQRLLACYTLASPLIQALTMLYLPINLLIAFYGDIPPFIRIINTIGFFMIIVQVLVNIAGLYKFTSVHQLRPSLLLPFWIFLFYLPYQVLEAVKE